MPRENRTVCELGLGMNPNVTELCGYPLLDEKMAGTFHIAVGANTMFGGENQANDHVDFVGQGSVEVIDVYKRQRMPNTSCLVYRISNPNRMLFWYGLSHATRQL